MSEKEPFITLNFIFFSTTNLLQVFALSIFGFLFVCLFVFLSACQCVRSKYLMQYVTKESKFVFPRWSKFTHYPFAGKRLLVAQVYLI